MHVLVRRGRMMRLRTWCMLLRRAHLDTNPFRTVTVLKPLGLRLDNKSEFEP